MKSTPTRTDRAAVPAVALGALTVSGPSAASAATAWWHSGGPHGSGATFYNGH